MAHELDKKNYQADFNTYPSTVNWNDSPLVQERMSFTKHQKVGIQLAFSAILLLAIYSAYYSVDIILSGTPTTGLKDVKDTDLSGWFLILVPILAIIPGVYTFMFLKYNFNKNGLLFKQEKSKSK
jgi:hypothetical protein